MANDRHDLAMFIDFENIALGLRGRAEQHFEVKKVLERLLETGKIIVKRAYADWSRFSTYTRPFHEAAIELIEVPRTGAVGKNSADIRLCVDAMDLCYAKEHIDTFVILSGDSDFSPLVSKLKENGKRVIGLGLRGSTSNLLVSNCDEFIFYESIEPEAPQISAGLPKTKPSLMSLVTTTLSALLREGRDPIQASLIKDTIRRKQPSFSETDYGYRSFTNLLEDAQAQGLLILREDPRSGTFFVSTKSPVAAVAPAAPAAPATEAPQPAAQPQRFDKFSAQRGGKYSRYRTDRRHQPQHGSQAAPPQPSAPPAPAGASTPASEPVAASKPPVMPQPAPFVPAPEPAMAAASAEAKPKTRARRRAASGTPAKKPATRRGGRRAKGGEAKGESKGEQQQ